MLSSNFINLLLTDIFRYEIFMKKCYLVFQTKIFYEIYVLFRKIADIERKVQYEKYLKRIKLNNDLN